MLGRLRRPGTKRTSKQTRDGTPITETMRDGADAPNHQLESGAYPKRAGIEIGSLLFKMVPSLLETRWMVANQIRRLRRHEETSVVQRHDPSNAFYRRVEEDRVKLAALCSKLLHIEVNDTHCQPVLEETLALCANDPGVYHLFQETMREKFSSLDTDSKLGHEKIHTFWSNLIGRPEFENEDFKLSYKEILGSKNSKDYTHVSQVITLEYLTLALPLDFKIGAATMSRLLETWTELFEYLDGYESKVAKPTKEFLSPQCLAKIAPRIAGYGYAFKTVLNTFYVLPEVKIRHRGKYISGVEFSYGSSKTRNIIDASSYAVPFQLSNWYGEPRRETVLSSVVWMALYHVSEFASSTYLQQNGADFSVDFAAEPIRWHHVIDLAKAFLKTLANETDRNYTEDGARAAFFITQSFDIDRYCKRAVLLDFSDDTTSINLLNFHSRCMNRLEIPNSLYDLSFMPQFENVPYLRRFKVNGEYFITSDGLPGAFTQLTDDSKEQVIQDCSMDTMLLDGHTVVCLSINNEDAFEISVNASLASFDCTGHYPILAYVNNPGTPVYVAAVRLETNWYFGTVEEGASSMTYFDELGEEQSSKKLLVLALRHDPSDVQPPYPPARKGAMDPTGPVFWLKFWPERDPDYYEEPRLRDDRILESFLNELRDRGEMERYLLSGFD